MTPDHRIAKTDGLDQAREHLNWGNDAKVRRRQHPGIEFDERKVSFFFDTDLLHNHAVTDKQCDPASSMKDAKARYRGEGSTWCLHSENAVERSRRHAGTRASSCCVARLVAMLDRDLAYWAAIIPGPRPAALDEDEVPSRDGVLAG